MFFGIPACTFSLIAAGTGATDISVSDLLSLLETSSVICEDPSHSDSASILFILLELVLIPLCSLYYTYFVQQILYLVSSMDFYHYTSLAR